jgi:hypothetical protein
MRRRSFDGLPKLTILCRSFDRLPKLTMRCRSFDELPKLTTTCRSFDGLPKDRQPAEADDGLPKLTTRRRSFGHRSKLRSENVGACGFERDGTIARRSGDPRERGGGELGEGGAGRPGYEGRAFSQRTARSGRPKTAGLSPAVDAGSRPVESATQDSPAPADEPEARPRRGDPANAGDPRRATDANPAREGRQASATRSETRSGARGAQQVGGDRLSGHGVLSSLRVLDLGC